MNKRWSDFLFAVAVRTLCGLLIGGSVGLVVGWRIILRHAAHNDMRWVVLWLLTWTVGGAVLAALRIPHWQTPWYKRIEDSDEAPEESAKHSANARPNVEYTVKPVSPQDYNRLAHPSLKQFHDFTRWLRQTTIAELETTRGDIEATKAVFVRFFRRGFKADLLVAELTELLPSIVASAGYSDPERSEVVTMLKVLNLEQLGVKPDEKGLSFDGHVP